MVTLDPKAVARRLLKEEVERIVADVLANGRTLVTGRHAASLFAAYPDANFSVGRIVDELVAEAARAKVPVQITRPD